MAPYEALYGCKYRIPVHWDEVGEQRISGPKIIERIVGVVAKIREELKQHKIDRSPIQTHEYKIYNLRLVTKFFLEWHQ